MRLQGYRFGFFGCQCVTKMSSTVCEHESAHHGHDKGHSVCLFVCCCFYFFCEKLYNICVLFFSVEQQKRMQAEFLKATVAYFQPLRQIVNKG